jgi:putative endonuclease
VGATKSAWYVYLLECVDGTYYTGVANDVERRLEEHNDGRGAKYTRGRGPVRLLAQSGPLTKSEAHSIEYRVKQLARGDKRAAVAAAGEAP